jgi:glycosyltransferase involved in cell wall biosynthesis
MSDRATITAALITLDEERNLIELLPMLDWVDQIVVVDGGSRDATVSVARRHGCRVASRRFDSYARQRDYALGLATGDWVFSIDADERPTPRLVAEIRSRIARSRAEAYRVPIRSWVFGRRLRLSGTQDDCPVRLFRRHAARWVGDVHEVLQVSGRVDRLHNWLTHDTTPDLETFLAKMHRYARLEANSRVVAGRRPACRDTWLVPAGEIFRRLIYKQGLWDGPAGWAFCFLSGLSAWVLARAHHRLMRLPLPRGEGRGEGASGRAAVQLPPLSTLADSRQTPAPGADRRALPAGYSEETDSMLTER